MWHIGLDVHWRTSTVCILDENGREVKTATVRGGWEKMLSWLDQEVAGAYRICYEASCGYGALYDRLRSRAAQVVVAHPGQVRLIFRAKRKSDRVDARKLARLLFLEAVPPVHVPCLEVRSWRRLIETRRRLVAKRTRVKNALRSLLRSHGLRGPRGLWSRQGLAWLREASWPSTAAALERDLLLAELALLAEQVVRLTAELDRLGRDQPGVVLLQTIPGIGPRTAEAVVAYIDQPERFGRSNQVGAYFGLVPRQDQSAAVNRLGHITKEGPASVRQLVVEAGWQVIRRSATVKARFERIAGGQKERRKIALVAVGHWLLRCMHAMLRTGECWREAPAANSAAA
jgi:transposase